MARGLALSVSGVVASASRDRTSAGIRPVECSIRHRASGENREPEYSKNARIRRTQRQSVGMKDTLENLAVFSK
ncbi:unnamed protein product [Parascedosporium putredinis]|uniref:Uncharacterized protein n=1 Tax=Parascedosporium putredinis TaxID=1442378 RepID=A0A9P1H5A6_9PEZI|nr:unnamed protein product [Parascedosporium putredinis]CAI7999041.1 unnamed protein product [Parascedosporium putredinis]